jgi:hypothetical protein
MNSGHALNPAEINPAKMRLNTVKYPYFLATGGHYLTPSGCSNDSAVFKQFLGVFSMCFEFFII